MKFDVYADIIKLGKIKDIQIKNSPQYKSISLGVTENKILLDNAKNQKKKLFRIRCKGL